MKKLIFSTLLLVLFLKTSFSLGANFEAMKANQPHIEAGEFLIRDFAFSVYLKKYPVNRTFKSYAYNLAFYKKSDTQQKARILFFIDSETESLCFWGMHLDKDLRGQGLAKPLLKFLFSFAREYNLTVKTVPQTKPRLAFILQSLGFRISRVTRDGERNMLYMDLDDRENFSCYTPPRNPIYQERFRESYEINPLEEKPKKSFALFLHQVLELSEKKLEAFLAKTPGDIYHTAIF